MSEQHPIQEPQDEAQQQTTTIAITCHADDPRYIHVPIEWRIRSTSPYRYCSYCGCLHPDDVRTIIEEGGTLGGADWKYGYPHKFYVYPKGSKSMYKWYNQHLKDIKDEPAFSAFALLLKTHAGIEFSRDDEGHVMYRAPYHGYQKG